MPRRAILKERATSQFSLDKTAREQIAALARAGETTASAVVRRAVSEMYQRETGRRGAMRTYRYTPIDITSLTSTSLLVEYQSVDNIAYRIDIYENGLRLPEKAEALFLPGPGRLGIAWGADATWANVKDVETGIEMWLNDPEGWEAAN
jgi:hypothetical protein